MLSVLYLEVQRLHVHDTVQQVYVTYVHCTQDQWRIQGGSGGSSSFGRGLEPPSIRPRVRAHAYMTADITCKCVGEWAEILNRVQNSVRLHHQIDQAFPFSACNIEKLGEAWVRPGYEASGTYVLMILDYFSDSST